MISGCTTYRVEGKYILYSIVDPSALATIILSINNYIAS